MVAATSIREPGQIRMRMNYCAVPTFAFDSLATNKHLILILFGLLEFGVALQF